jgi:capsular exopolysaccharide synthesis family protein
MSRIDEALKRVHSQGPAIGRVQSVVDAPTRGADDHTLDEYPLEVGVADPRHERFGRPLGPAGQPDSPVGFAPDRASFRAPGEADERLVTSTAHSAVSVAQYRRLAAKLHDVQRERGLKTVVVTSALPGEGKTLTAVNLAMTLSESYGRRVLLIDSDLRKPSVHQILDVANDSGLSDVLRSHRDVRPVQRTSRLAVLPSGKPDSDPLVGLSSDRMQKLLKESAEKYDWVILDAPPAVLPDAEVIVRLTQAMVFVIRAGVTPSPAVAKAISDLGREYVVGVVLNGVNDAATPAKAYYKGY